MTENDIKGSFLQREGKKEGEVTGQEQTAAPDDQTSLEGPNISELMKGPRMKEAILASIRKGSEFPAMATTAGLLTDLTTSEDASTTELANIILKDYGLTSKILKLVNTVFFIRFGEVTTISRAILLLGCENICNTVVSMSLFDRMLKSESQHLPNLLSKAIYAGVIGQQIAIKVRCNDPEEAFLCSLFYYLGEILTSYYVPNRYLQIKEYCEKEAGPGGLTPAVQDLYREIGKGIAAQWGFPGKVVLCMEKLDKSVMAGRNDLDRLRCVSLIANRIADITERHSDKGKKNEEIEEILSFFGSQYSQLRESIDEIAETSLSNLDKYCQAYGINFRTSSIGERLGEACQEEQAVDREEIIGELLSDFTASMTGTQKAVEETQDPETIFANGLRDITRAMLDNDGMDDIFRIIMETIYRGLRTAGISRTVLLIRNTSKPMFDVRLAMGDSIASLRKWFCVPVSEKEEDIFSISTQRKKDLLIKDSESQSAERLLPPWLTKAFAVPSYVMVLPTVVKGKTIGLLYIEGKREGLVNILPAHLNYITILHGQALLAIQRRSVV
jgi:HD-like signal output (HDOD) protein